MTFAFQCRGINKNGIAIWRLVLKEILLVSIVNYTGELDIFSSRRRPRIFFQIGQKFTSDRYDFLVEMCILLRLILLGPCGRGEKVGTKWNNRSSVTILWDIPHPGPPVLLVVESNHFCCVRLIHSTVSEKCRLNLWGKSDALDASTIYAWFFTIPCTLGPSLFVGLSLPLFFFIPFIMLVGWMVHIHYINFPFHILLGSPISILTIPSNIIFLLLDSPGFNIVKSST